MTHTVTKSDFLLYVAESTIASSSKGNKQLKIITDLNFHEQPTSVFKLFQNNELQGEYEELFGAVLHYNRL